MDKDKKKGQKKEKGASAPSSARAASPATELKNKGSASAKVVASSPSFPPSEPKNAAAPAPVSDSQLHKKSKKTISQSKSKSKPNIKDKEDIAVAAKNENETTISTQNEITSIPTPVKTVNEPEKNSVPVEGWKESKEKEFNDIVSFIICDQIAQSYLDLAFDICGPRFAHENASSFIISDLRDAWLTIANQSWMDQDPLITKGLHPTKSVSFGMEDVPPLPIQFDFWSHGALEMLPNRCRESVIDPFLRSLLPWYNYDEFRGEHDVEEHEQTPSWRIRPTSPVPTEYSTTQTYSETWSTASIIGSKGSDTTTTVESVDWKGATTTTTASESDEKGKNGIPDTQPKSVKVLHKKKNPPSMITGSSEISYRRRNSDRGKERICFRLPNRTSSESIKILWDEKSNFDPSCGSPSTSPEREKERFCCYCPGETTNDCTDY